LTNLYWFVPVAVAIVSLGGYQAYNDKLNLANVLSALQIFYFIQWPLYQLPMFLTKFYDAIVSMRRIQVIAMNLNNVEIY
jgi:ABC-type multidrug transport system fused ATPase/permease subunit